MDVQRQLAYNACHVMGAFWVKAEREFELVRHIDLDFQAEIVKFEQAELLLHLENLPLDKGNK